MKSPKKSSPEATISANVSTLKTHLGKYLRKVKQGAEVIVLDRQLPVAKLVEFSGQEESLVEIAPILSWKEVGDQFIESDRRKKPTPLKRTSAYYLGEDRRSK